MTARLKLAPTLALLGTCGCHLGVGPVLAHRVDDGTRLGWEASGGFGLLRGSVGQAYALESARDTPIYLAGEPGILLGVTVGVDYETDDAGFMGGVWVGAPVYELRHDGIERALDMRPTLSGAIGYRYIHGHEFYLTPKMNLIEQIDFH